MSLKYKCISAHKKLVKKYKRELCKHNSKNQLMSLNLLFKEDLEAFQKEFSDWETHLYFGTKEKRSLEGLGLTNGEKVTFTYMDIDVRGVVRKYTLLTLQLLLLEDYVKNNTTWYKGEKKYFSIDCIEDFKIIS